MTLKIRTARPEDAGHLAALFKIDLPEYQTVPDVLAAQTEILPQADLPDEWDVLIAEDGGRPVGIATGKLYRDHYLVGALCVLPGHCQQGTGSLLLERMTDLASACGAPALRLQTNSEEASLLGPHGLTPRSSLEAAEGKTSYANLIMEKAIAPMVRELKDMDIRVDQTSVWPFEEDNRSAIEDHWRQAQNHNPHLWNGRVLKLTSHSFEDGVLSGICHETSFAAFLAWRDWGAPDRTTRNLFGSALIRSREGFLLYGVMSERTANPGKIYPPGGNIDMADVTEHGRVNVFGSLYRELAEETGLRADQVIEGQTFAVFEGPRLCIGKVMNVDQPAEELRSRILAHSMVTEEQELSDVRILQSSVEANGPLTPVYARALAQQLLPGPGE